MMWQVLGRLPSLCRIHSIQDPACLEGVAGLAACYRFSCLSVPCFAVLRYVTGARGRASRVDERAAIKRYDKSMSMCLRSSMMTREVESQLAKV